MFASLQITRGMSTPYHPQTDGQVERLNETLSSMLRHFVSVRQTDWDSKLPILALAYNNRRHSSSSFSPYELVFGQHPRLLGLDEVSDDGALVHSEWVDELRAARQEAGVVIELSSARQKTSFDAGRTDFQLQVGGSGVGQYQELPRTPGLGRGGATEAFSQVRRPVPRVGEGGQEGIPAGDSWMVSAARRFPRGCVGAARGRSSVDSAPADARTRSR